jgi:hypothetical protein
MSSLAEKFQINIPYKEEANGEDGSWISLEKVRCTADIPKPDLDKKFNVIPKTEIYEQFEVNGSKERMDNWAHGFGGNTDVSSMVTKESINNPKCLAQGFVRREMKATDDQYSGEHIDLFYSEAVDEQGQVSFVERNNYLDRL